MNRSYCECKLKEQGTKGLCLVLPATKLRN